MTDVDLVALDALYQAVMTGEWVSYATAIGDPSDGPGCFEIRSVEPVGRIIARTLAYSRFDCDDAISIVALHNAYPALAAWIRDAVKELAEIRETVACQCDEAYTSRNRHEPNAVCYLTDDIDALLGRVHVEAKGE